MAPVDDMWFHVRNPELAPLLEAADARFAERSGTTRDVALHHEPQGGEWVDVWLSALQEVGDDHRGQILHLVSGVSLGIPDESQRRHEVPEEMFKEQQQAVWSRNDELSQAAQNWQFAWARIAASNLWDAMNELYASCTPLGSAMADDWVDLRPLLQ